MGAGLVRSGGVDHSQLCDCVFMPGLQPCTPASSESLFSCLLLSQSWAWRLCPLSVHAPCSIYNLAKVQVLDLALFSVDGNP